MCTLICLIPTFLYLASHVKNILSSKIFFYGEPLVTNKCIHWFALCGVSLFGQCVTLLLSGQCPKYSEYCNSYSCSHDGWYGITQVQIKWDPNLAFMWMHSIRIIPFVRPLLSPKKDEGIHTIVNAEILQSLK